MRSDLDPRVLLIVAFGLLLIGFGLPLLMIMQVVESTLLFNFIAYIVITLGGMLGFTGIASLVIQRRRGE